MLKSREHICTIGVLHKSDYAETVGIKELVVHQIERKELHDYEVNNGYPNCIRYFTMREYLDCRTSTDLQRFTHCPYCGEPINWKSMREEYSA